MPQTTSAMRRRGNWLTRAARSARAALPEGRLLPAATWERRHKAIVALLWAHVVALALWQMALLLGGRAPGGAPHTALELGALLSPALLAVWGRLGRQGRAAAATMGLLTSSALVVHLSGGYIEAHFHFFVMIAVITLYHDWLPFLVAIAYVVLHHGVVGFLVPGMVFNHPEAVGRPWLWALIHGAFVLSASVASIVNWRFSEDAHARRKEAELAVRALNGRLERRVEERTRELAAAVGELSAREGVIRQQAERQRQLNEFARAVGGTLDLASLAALITDQVIALIGCDRCSIVEYDAAQDAFRLVAARRRDGTADVAAGTQLASRGTLAEKAVRSLAPVVVADTAEAALTEVARRANAGLRSLACVPIIVSGTVWGVVGAGFAAAHGATPERVQFLEALAAQLGSAIRNTQLYGDLSSAHDELRSAQERIVRQERLQAIGQMASGIAHDLNNALAPVVGFSDLLLTHEPSLGDPEKLRRYLHLIHAGAGDAASVVGRMREAFRNRAEHDTLGEVDLSAVVRQVVSLTEPKWRDEALSSGRTISVETHLHPTPCVAGNDAELREALTNLIFNAVDALPDGGVITVRVWPGDDRGEWVMLEVADTGVGMPEEVRRRCLEPFFTTKGERGTGLGLAMVYGVVQRHRGSIEFDSAPGAGTRFVVRLPRWTAGAARRPAVKSTPAIRPLHVLVVDDEPTVREVAAAILKSDGHTVSAVSDGAGALDAFGSAAFDVVVTDKAMPSMTGDQLALAIKGLSPATPVIMLTGFGDLMAARGETPDGIDAVLGKPITRQRLRETLARVTA